MVGRYFCECWVHGFYCVSHIISFSVIWSPIPIAWCIVEYDPNCHCEISFHSATKTSILVFCFTVFSHLGKKVRGSLIAILVIVQLHFVAGIFVCFMLTLPAKSWWLRADWTHFIQTMFLACRPFSTLWLALVPSMCWIWDHPTLPVLGVRVLNTVQG